MPLTTKPRAAAAATTAAKTGHLPAVQVREAQQVTPALLQMPVEESPRWHQAFPWPSTSRTLLIPLCQPPQPWLKYRSRF